VSRLKRRIFLRDAAWLAASAAGLTLLSSACGLLPSQTPARVPRIGFLGAQDRETMADRVDAFLQGLRDLGYVEGQTIAIEWRFSPEGSANQFAEMAAELVRLQVDVIVADGSTVAAQAAKQATSTIPIVFVAAALSPVETGLVASLARPGGNLTAISNTTPGIYAKWVQLLRDVVPGLARTATLSFPGNPATVGIADEVRSAATASGVVDERIDLQSVNDVEVAFQEAASRGADGVIIAAIALLLRAVDHVAEVAVRHCLPTIGGTRDFVQAGSLMWYGANPLATRRRAAVYVDRILKGAKPADLPVEQPTVFDLVVNLKTARALRLSIPPSVAQQVTEWIQ
jgi:putative ABC transport system substrate-binding protein